MYQSPRGTADILPAEQAYWHYIREKAEAVTARYGYGRLDTPTFEDTGLFTRGVGEGTDIVEKEMYTFTDKGGSSLTLRPEGTASVCRAYLEHGMHNLSQPVKLYYQTPVFRYERPQAGRLREHHQFGCEAIGEADAAVDAEVIEMAWQFFQALGLEKLSLILNSIGCRGCRPGYLEILKEYYTPHAGELCRDCRTRLVRNPLRLLDCKQATCQGLAEAAPKSADNLCPDCAGHYAQLRRYLDLLGIGYRLSHRLVRGLDYYTRTVFEIEPEQARGQSTLGGGGRYDDLIEMLGGRPTPAIGFACGLERIVLNLKKQGICVPDLPAPRIYIAHRGGLTAEAAIKTAAALRQAGIGAVAGTGGRSLKAQLRQAGAQGAAFTVIIGEDELARGAATVKSMADGGQRDVTLAELAGYLGSNPDKHAAH
ncbi:histidine--tRNA ligase [Chloroflexota bacterium]